MNVDVTWVGIIVAVGVSMALGFLWYSPIVLGKPWQKEKGFTPESMQAAQKEMGKWYLVSAVLALITAYVLNHVIVFSLNFFNGQYSNLATGLMSGFYMWLGFMMPVQATATLFGDRKWRLFAIDTGYQLVSILAMGVAIGFLLK